MQMQRQAKVAISHKRRLPLESFPWQKMGILMPRVLAQKLGQKGQRAGSSLVALQTWVQVLSNVNMAGDPQRNPGLTAQVFLAYADEDRARDGRGGQDDGLGAVITPDSIAVNALRQLLTTAQIAHWEFPRPWPTAVDPESTMSRATEACDNYLLVLSPRSLVDVYCLQGLLFALSMNKRIVPVLAETVPKSRLPEPLQTLQTIDLRTTTPPLMQTDPGRRLLQILHHEADYHRAHTQLLVKALHWERHLRDPMLLLQGEELADYQRWLVQANGRSRYQFIQLQALYVAESVRQWGDRDDLVAQGIGWLKRLIE